MDQAPYKLSANSELSLVRDHNYDKIIIIGTLASTGGLSALLNVQCNDYIMAS